MGKPIGPAWWFTKPYVSLPVFMLNHPKWVALKANDKALYIEMRKVIGNGSGQYKPERICFGPSRVSRLMDKRAYRKSIQNLIEAGFINELKPGHHGGEGCYDITLTDWYMAQ